MKNEIKQRALDNNKIMFDILKAKFGDEPFIQKSYRFSDGRDSTIDFKVYAENGKQLHIDLFFPKDRNSFMTCVNAKIKKFNTPIYWGETFIVNMNEVIDSSISGRSKTLPENIKVMSFSSFKEYTNTLNPSVKLPWML